ncbi:MAG: leucine-rich repeat domain-containing protein [Aureispira sp.]
MSCIPPWVRQLRKLKRLSCRSCNIKVLPDWMDELPALESLNLASNPLQTLPTTLQRLPKLKRLNIGMTPLIPSQRKGLLTNRKEVHAFLEFFLNKGFSLKKNVLQLRCCLPKA